jgi:hypothetical protein
LRQAPAITGVGITDAVTGVGIAAATTAHAADEASRVPLVTVSAMARVITERLATTPPPTVSSLKPSAACKRRRPSLSPARR